MAQEDITKRIEQERQQASSLESLQQSIPYDSPCSPATVRAHVTRVVIWTWALFVALAGLFYVFGESAATKERMEQLLEVVKIALLPVVTFVIGHYFGSKSE